MVRGLRPAALAGAVGVLLLSGCGSTGAPSGGAAATPPAPIRSCAGVHFPFPPAAATLTAADAGRNVSVHVGDLVAVTLLGSRAPGGRWPEILASGLSLQPLVNTANAATVGTQLGEYCAVSLGSTTLTSGSWQATVGVR